jgi:hypothetical protein
LRPDPKVFEFFDGLDTRFFCAGKVKVLRPDPKVLLLKSSFEA